MEDIPKRGRGKRGIALFKKKREPEEYRVEFDENNIPLTKEFMSWFGMLMTWNIETDAPEEFMRKKAVKIGTNFRSRLVKDYVNTNTSPCEKYTFQNFGKQLSYLIIEETPSKSTRMDSSHSSPQKDSATTSFYYPQFVDNQIPIHPFDGGYTNMLLSLTPRQIATNPTEPKFIDPDVEVSLSILRKKCTKYNKILDLLSSLFGDDFYISTYSPQGLYPDRVQFAVPYSEILQPLLNDLLDVSIIRWFAMYFYGLPNNSNCVFFDPEVIKDSNVQTNPCNKQKDSWECGYLVIKHMHEFVVSIQHDIYIRVRVLCISFKYQFPNYLYTLI
ncbi:hypothetical protein LXL04_008208 [Taraxacum kok-saghyz]